MPMTSQKNDPLSPAGVDLGLGTTPGEDAETEEERRKRLAMAQKQMGGNPSGALMDLGLAG